MSYHPYNNYNLSAQPNSSSSTRSPHSQYRDSPPASGNPPFPAQGGASRLPFPTHHGPSQNGPPLPPIMAQYPQAQDNPPHPAGAMAQLGRSPHMSDVNWAAMPPPNGPQHPQGPGLTGSAHPTPSPPWYLPSSAHGTSQYLPDGRNPDPSRSRHPPYNDFQDTRRQPEGPPPPVSHRPPASDPGSSQGPPPPPEDGNGRQSGWLSSRRFSGWLSSTSSVIQYVMGQHVHVHITANRWVVGIIVAFVYITEQITGSIYEVEFVRGASGRREVPHEKMRPYQPGG